jgi:hypothetical protein
MSWTAALPKSRDPHRKAQTCLSCPYGQRRRDTQSHACRCSYTYYYNIFTLNRYTWISLCVLHPADVWDIPPTASESHMRRRARIQADRYTDASHPPGCFAVNCALPCAGEADPIRRELARPREASRARLRSRLQEGQLAGDLPADADPDELARFIVAVVACRKIGHLASLAGAPTSGRQANYCLRLGHPSSSRREEGSLARELNYPLVASYLTM